MTDPLDHVVAGPIVEDYTGPQMRIDTDDELRTVTLYVLKPDTNEAVSRLTLAWSQARALAHWIFESTTPD